jgi:Ca2+-binding RTX toxin-like protein
MTAYVADKSRVLLEDNTTMYNLAEGDSLWIIPGISLDIRAPHSSLATLGSNTSLTLTADLFTPTLASAIGNTFVGMGNRVSVNVGEYATIFSVKGYALYLEGSHNTIVNNGTLSCGDQPGVYTGRGVISSGGMTHLINERTIQGGKTAAYFSAGGNEVHNSGMIDGEIHALRIMGGNNTITNENLIVSGGTGGAAIYMISGGGGANLINNRGGWIKASSGSYAIQVTGLSNDTILNGPGRGGEGSNEGWIHGGIDLGLGDDEIENAGVIDGLMSLGSGNDRFDNSGKIYGNVQLGAGNDLFYGATGEHYKGYRGFAGILGGDGADTIIGGAKDEVISGGAGKDFLAGNAGQDTFWFDVTPGTANADRITQFNVAEDRFWLSSGVFGLGKGPLSAEQFCYGAKAQDAADRILYDSGTGTLSFDQDGMGGMYKPVIIATLDPGTALKADHFFVV